MGVRERRSPSKSFALRRESESVTIHLLPYQKLEEYSDELEADGTSCLSSLSLTVSTSSGFRASIHKADRLLRGRLRIRLAGKSEPEPAPEPPDEAA